MPDRLLLVGMMGAGKTTVGRLVADRLGWSYLDSDVEVTRMTGRSVPEVFAKDGEAAFRAAETEALIAAVAGVDPVVVAVAGGAVLSEQNRALLTRSGTVVWLRARTETLAARVGDGAGRPLLGADPAAALTALYAVREPLYDTVASTTVDVDGLQPEEVADQLVAAVRRATGTTATTATAGNGVPQESER